MKRWVIYSSFVLLACGTEPKEVTISSESKNTATAPAVADTPPDSGSRIPADNTTEMVTVTPVTPKPAGIYRAMLPYGEGKKILHTIAFYPTTYRLQEEYPGKPDSVVITQGTWAPSGGYIWLYRDQVAAGRYTWKGSTLQYYNPQLKKSTSMEKLVPAATNQVWQTKKKQGIALYGVGTEPFWSVEVDDSDSLVVNMPDWTSPLRSKITAADRSQDSVTYTASGDSLQLVVYPRFCSDGMSDFLYTQKLKLVYKGQTYKGCGEVFRPVR